MSRGWEEDHIVFAGKLRSGLATQPVRWTLKRAATEMITTFEKGVGGAWGIEAVERCQP
jgi:hypothetical protein